MPISPEITACDSSCLSAHNTGLGNCLFQIASVYGLAKTHGLIAYYDTVVTFSEKLERLFGFDHKSTIFRNFQISSGSESTTIQERCWRNYDVSLVDTLCKNSDKHFIIKGYLEYPGYFLPYIREIRELFSPDEASLSFLQSSLPILFDGTPTVGLHIRTQGVILNMQQQVCRPALGIDYYKAAIEKMESLVPDPMYLVFADQNYETINFLEGKRYKIVKHSLDYLDLWALMHCKNYIMTQSTFCFWAWFLNANKSNTIIPNIPSLNFYSDVIVV